jgi:hypothetical protein
MNKRTYIEIDGLKFEVMIVEEKTKFGRKMVKIMPVSGANEKWVNSESIIYPATRNKIINGQKKA